MPLRCPRCRSLVELPDQLNRYFDMPAACHMCQRVFAVPPQTPFHDSGVPYSLVRQMDRSISAQRCSHERACPSCRRRVRIPGLDPAIGPLDLSCPYCRARFHLQATGGINPCLIATALGLGIVFGLGLLWLDHQNLVALHQLPLSEMLLEQVRQLRTWAAELYDQVRTAAMARLV